MLLESVCNKIGNRVDVKVVTGRYRANCANSNRTKIIQQFNFYILFILSLNIKLKYTVSISNNNTQSQRDNLVYKILYIYKIVVIEMLYMSCPVSSFQNVMSRIININAYRYSFIMIFYNIVPNKTVPI